MPLPTLFYFFHHYLDLSVLFYLHYLLYLLYLSCSAMVKSRSEYVVSTSENYQRSIRKALQGRQSTAEISCPYGESLGAATWFWFLGASPGSLVWYTLKRLLQK